MTTNTKEVFARIEAIKRRQRKRKKKPKREPGAWKGQVRVSEDFDDQITLLSDEERSSTLTASRAYVLREREKGVTCPCCGQFAKLYKRKLANDMVRFLFLLYQYRAGKWVHLRREKKTPKLLRFRLGGDYAKVVYWGLAEERENKDQSIKHSGIWRLTERGRLFVERKIRVRSHAFVYNGACEGLTGSKITIEDALGEKFDYAELMGRKR